MKIPEEALQHTQAVTALSILMLSLDLYKGIGGDDEKWLAEIRRNAKACSTLTKKKRLSAGAKRAITNCQIILDEHINAMQGMRGKQLMKYWAALIWASYVFVEGVFAACPIYTQGIEEKKWRKLRDSIEELAYGFRANMPEVDDFGTYIYEKCAWALEDVPFKDDAMEKALAG